MKFFKGTAYTDFSLVLIKLNKIANIEEIEKGSNIVFKGNDKQSLLVRDSKYYLEQAKKNIEYCNNLCYYSTSDILRPYLRLDNLVQ